MLSHFFEAKSFSILFALKFLPILRSPEDRVGDVGITQTFLMGLSKPIAQLLGIRAVTLHEFIFNRWFSSEVHEQHQHSDLGSSRKWRDHLALVVSLGWRDLVSGSCREGSSAVGVHRCTLCRLCLNTLEFAARPGVTTQQGGAKVVSWERKERGEGDLNDENGKWSGFKSLLSQKRPVISQGPTSLHGQVLCSLDSLRSLRRDCKKS